MQALESLNDNQVNDFLSGKTPLNLSMRLGDHMMLIQLQLSTVTPTTSGHHQSQRTSRSSMKSRITSTATQPMAGPTSSKDETIPDSPTIYSGTDDLPIYSSISSRTSRSRTTSVDMDNNPFLSSVCPTPPATASPSPMATPLRDFDNMKSIYNDLTNTPPSSTSTSTACSPVTLNFTDDSQMLDQSPIKSLSNLVSSPIQTTPIKSYPSQLDTPESPPPSVEDPSPLTISDAAKFTSCICKRLNAIASCDHAVMHRTTNNPISRKRNWSVSASNRAVFVRRTKSSDNLGRAETPSTSSVAVNDTAAQSPPGNLAEASRSLAQTLRKLSKEVFTNKTESTKALQANSVPRKSTGNGVAASNSNSSSSGAVIESMKNHGKGIYSGTFSGTLNPALQDRNGRPKRDISTVIHILNDLLSATPHYTRGARICFEPTTTMTTTTTRSIKPVTNRHTAIVNRSTNCSKCNATLTNKSTSCPTNDCSGPNLTPSQRCRCSRALHFDDDEPKATSSSSSSSSPTGCHCPPLSTDAATVAPICTKCRLVERENNQTKSKLDQLRLVMQQKKARREARKLQTAPYSPTAGSAAARLLAAASAANAQHNVAAAATSTTAAATATSPASSTSPAACIAEVATINNIVEEVDTAA